MFRKSAFIPVCLAYVASPCIALANPEINDDYKLAVAAIKNNDCKSAVPLLKKYLLVEADNIAKFPLFQKQINDQISICSSVITTSILKGLVKTEIKGQKIQDMTQVSGSIE